MPKDSIYNETLRARISPSMLARLDKVAADQGRHQSEVVRDAIRDYLRKEEGACEKCGAEKEKSPAAQTASDPHLQFPYSKKSSKATKKGSAAKSPPEAGKDKSSHRPDKPANHH